MKQKITIMGAGSSGMATAAWLTLEGWNVTLWDTPEQSEDFSVICANGGIRLVGGSGRNGLILPDCLSNDLEEALSDTDLIVICTSASRHQEIADLCAPMAKAGQTYLLAPGNFGSFLMRQKLEQNGKTGVLVGEICGGLWACRRTAPGEVLVTAPMKRDIRCAALPACDTEDLIKRFSQALSLKAGTNVLEVSLNSPNVISHVGGAVLNVASIERKKEKYAFFMDGLSDSVIQCFGKLEEERAAVMATVGLEVYNPSSQGFMRKLMEYDKHRELDLFRSLDGPSGFQHRYVAEDANCGVAMLISLGHQYGVSIPLTEAMLTVAQAITGTDYLKGGRTLEKLGLSGLSSEELKTYLANLSH